MTQKHLGNIPAGRHIVLLQRAGAHVLRLKIFFQENPWLFDLFPQVFLHHQLESSSQLDVGKQRVNQ